MKKDNIMKKLFGNHIAPDCTYCQNFIQEGQPRCSLGRVIGENGKCRKFDYNPTLRTPKAEAVMMQFSKEDFEL